MALKRVVIGGGTGFIGTQLLESLRRESIACISVSRKRGVDQITWEDLKQNGLPDGTSAVINVAGQNVLDPLKRWTSDFQKTVWNSRVETTKILADAVAKANKTVAFATISGVAYYKPNGSTYTEESICEPYDFLSELCHSWEGAATQLQKINGTRVIIVRSGVVLGRSGGMIKQIYLPFYCGMGGPMGSGDQCMPWIHVTDLVNLFVFAIKSDNVSGILNGVAPQIITNKEFTKAFASAMNRPAFFPLPRIAINTIFGPERAKMMLEGQKVHPKRVVELGFKYQYPDINSACKQVIS